MIIPPILIGAALVFWGWQTDNLIAGSVLAIAMEAPRRMALRFDHGAPEQLRIADLAPRSTTAQFKPLSGSLHQRDPTHAKTVHGDAGRKAGTAERASRR